MKYHGRFLSMFLGNLITPAMPLFIDGEEGGAVVADDAMAGTVRFGEQSSSEASPETGDKGEQSSTSDGQAASEVGETVDDKASGSPEGQAPEVSDDDLLASLSGDESPEDKASRLERDYSASSKEAKNLNAEKKAFVKALDEQGLKYSMKDGQVELIPTDKYSKDAPTFNADISKMSSDIQEAFESGDIEEVQKAMDKIIGQATKALVRPNPTRETERPELSAEKRESVLKHMEEAKDALGELKFEGFDKNKSLIGKMFDDANQPEAVRDAIAAAPEYMAELFNARLNAQRAYLGAKNATAKAAAEKKAAEAKNNNAASPQNQGTASEKSNVSNAYLDSIGKSRI